MARAHDGCQRTRGHWEDQQRFRHRGDIDRVNGLDRASPTQSFLLDSATSPRPVLRFHPSMSIAVPDPTSFLAIDFETATSRRDSACAIGLAVGCAGRVVLSRTYLIRPPTTRFTFSDLHGLTWKDVRDAPSSPDGPFPESECALNALGRQPRAIPSECPLANLAPVRGAVRPLPSVAGLDTLPVARPPTATPAHSRCGTGRRLPGSCAPSATHLWDRR